MIPKSGYRLSEKIMLQHKPEQFPEKWTAVLRRECDQNKTGNARPGARVPLFASTLMESFEHTDGPLWVFAYGSLMWRPGFDYAERVPARLIGLHRALCVYSFVHRGTPEKPGLVLRADRGGACRRRASRVAAGTREATIEYLREREQVTAVYLETMRRI